MAVGLHADVTNLPPDLGLGTAPAISNSVIPAPVIAAPLAAPAVTETNAAPAKAKKAAKPKPVKLPGAFSGVVASVNTNALTLTLAGPAPGRVLAMSSQSRLFHKTKPITFAQINVGDQIRGQAKKNAKGPDTILNATFSAKAAGALQTKTKKPAKKAVDKTTGTTSTPPTK